MIHVRSAAFEYQDGIVPAGGGGEGGGEGGGVEAVTETVTESLALPPTPSQVNVKSVVLVSIAVSSEPETGRGPVQPPLASHVVA